MKHHPPFQQSEFSRGPYFQPQKSGRGKIASFLILMFLSLAIAIGWALNDIGWWPGPWGKLALIFFTWAVLAIALYRAFFGNGD